MYFSYIIYIHGVHLESTPKEMNTKKSFFGPQYTSNLPQKSTL